jgi:rhodanese-related sulfurtransferase
MNIPPGNAADEILPGLWLGNARASQDIEFMKRNRIDTVFNCTKNLPFVHSVKRKYRLPVDDNLQEEEIRNMELMSCEVIYKVIHEYKQGPILVHCAAGMQRSAAVVAMFLIATKNMKAEQAIRYIQERRPIAFRPGTNFLKSIKGFEVVFDRDIRPGLLERGLPKTQTY